MTGRYLTVIVGTAVMLAAGGASVHAVCKPVGSAGHGDHEASGTEDVDVDGQHDEAVPRALQRRDEADGRHDEEDERCPGVERFG